jgi:hypothetical protein
MTHVGMTHRGFNVLYVGKDLSKELVTGTKTQHCFIPSEQNSKLITTKKI